MNAEPENCRAATAVLRIRSVYQSLAEAERRVANFICEEPQAVIRMAITELATQCNTSEATVMRMCRKAGFRGFTDMKLILAQDLVTPVDTIQHGLKEGDGPETVLNITFRSVIETLEHTLRLVDATTFQAVTDALRRAGQIDIYGSGNSASIARDLQHKLRRLGLRAAAYEDSHMQIISATALQPGDVAVGISQSGASECIINAIRLASDRGATTVALTSYGGTPLAQVCQYKLLCAPESDSFPVVGLKSRLAQLTIIAALHTNLALNDMDRFVPHLRAMEREIAQTKL